MVYVIWWGIGKRKVLNIVLFTSHTSSEMIDAVLDTYRDQPFKDAERANPSYNVKNWRRILWSSDRKRHPIYFVRDWERKQHLVGENKQLCVKHESKCISITKEAVMEVPELASTHQEADTWVIHAFHAACSCCDCCWCQWDLGTLHSINAHLNKQ